jgi:hypothetical protein
MSGTRKDPTRSSAFATMLREKREKLSPGANLREFCAARGLDVEMIAEMERDRRTAPGTYGALYKLASGYGHGPTDRWTKQLLEAALGIAPPPPRRASTPKRSERATPKGHPTVSRAASASRRRTSMGRG